MGKVLVAFDEDTSKVLATKVNKSEFIREAVSIYIECISTDSLGKMSAAFRQSRQMLLDLTERTAELYEIVERMNNTLEEMGNR